MCAMSSNENIKQVMFTFVVSLPSADSTYRVPLQIKDQLAIATVAMSHSA